MEEIALIPDNPSPDMIQRLFSKEGQQWARERVQSFAKLMAYYRCAMMEIETKLNVLNVEFSLQHDRNPISSIKTRLKSPVSIKEKMERRGISFTLENLQECLHDVAGVRVVCSFPEDVYMLADALLAQDDITLLEMKDYIQNPKDNGYRSLHMIITVPIFLAQEKKIIKVEVQLRTIAMDCWASLEHQLRYKKDFEFTDEMAADLLECAEMSAVLDQKMDRLRKFVQEGVHG